MSPPTVGLHEDPPSGRSPCLRKIAAGGLTGLGPQTHTVSCELGKPSHKSIGQAVSCSGRDSKGTRVVSQVSSSGRLGGRNPGQDGVELHQSPGPRTVREQRGPGAETTRHRSQGGMGKREKEKRLLVRPSASRSPPAPGGCWTPRHAARPRCTHALCCPHTGPGPAPPAPARASRPHRPPAPARSRPRHPGAPSTRPRTPAPARAPQSSMALRHHY